MLRQTIYRKNIVYARIFYNQGFCSSCAGNGTY